MDALVVKLDIMQPVHKTDFKGAFQLRVAPVYQGSLFLAFIFKTIYQLKHILTVLTVKKDLIGCLPVTGKTTISDCGDTHSGHH